MKYMYIYRGEHPSHQLYSQGGDKIVIVIWNDEINVYLP